MENRAIIGLDRKMFTITCPVVGLEESYRRIGGGRRLHIKYAGSNGTYRVKFENHLDYFVLGESSIMHNGPHNDLPFTVGGHYEPRVIDATRKVRNTDPPEDIDQDLMGLYCTAFIIQSQAQILTKSIELVDGRALIVVGKCIVEVENCYRVKFLDSTFHLRTDISYYFNNSSGEQVRVEAMGQYKSIKVTPIVPHTWAVSTNLTNEERNELNEYMETKLLNYIETL